MDLHCAQFFELKYAKHFRNILNISLARERLQKRNKIVCKFSHQKQYFVYLVKKIIIFYYFWCFDEITQLLGLTLAYKQIESLVWVNNKKFIHFRSISENNNVSEIKQNNLTLKMLPERQNRTKLNDGTKKMLNWEECGNWFQTCFYNHPLIYPFLTLTFGGF
jgi:DNA integrity scanning protein DisA with diadenylate cyclase activity